MKLLAANGIKCFYSKCLTLTFPKRESEPKEKKVFLVDVYRIPIPESLRKQAIIVTHATSDIYSSKIKSQMAKRLLSVYRNEASLVITTKLHCALPCIAMGVPVVFFGNPNDSRLSILHDLKVKINKLPGRLCRASEERLLTRIPVKLAVRRFLKNVDWDPQSVCIEKEKQILKTMTEELLRNKVNEEDVKNIEQFIPADG